MASLASSPPDSASVGASGPPASDEDAPAKTPAKTYAPGQSPEELDRAAMLLPKDLGYSRNNLTVCTPLKAVPRFPWRDPRALELASAGQPVIFTETKLVDVAVDKWSLRYLEKHILPTTTFTVFSAPVQGDFMYSDVDKGITEEPDVPAAGGGGGGGGGGGKQIYRFQRHSIKEKLTFKQFARRMKLAFRQPATPPYDDDLVAAPGVAAEQALSGETLRKARENWGDDWCGRESPLAGDGDAIGGVAVGGEDDEVIGPSNVAPGAAAVAYYASAETSDSSGSKADAAKTGAKAGGFMQGFLPGIQDPRIRPKQSSRNNKDHNKHAARSGKPSTSSNSSAEGKGSSSPTAASSSKSKPPAKDDAKSYSPSRFRTYLQQPLYAGIGKQIKKDFGRFHWAWVQAMQALLPAFADLTTNMLLIGERGNITPCHYDEQQNMFAQVRGRKRVVLYSPKYWRSFYTHPVNHTADRQSQVDLYRPDLERFPRFAEARGVEAILQPGEVLYIPSLWFHHIECLDTPCTSVNFWFKCAPDDPMKVSLPLKDPVRLLSMRRNVEKITMKKLGNARAARFWDTLARWLKTRLTASKIGGSGDDRGANEVKEGAVVKGQIYTSGDAGETWSAGDRADAVAGAVGAKDRADVGDSSTGALVSAGTAGGQGVTLAAARGRGERGVGGDAGSVDERSAMLQYEGDTFEPPSPEDLVQFAEHEASIRQMLKAVLAPDKIDDFLMEMTDGRFVYLEWGPGSGLKRE